jgi:hypothetical protein
MPTIPGPITPIFSIFQFSAFSGKFSFTFLIFNGLNLFDIIAGSKRTNTPDFYFKIILFMTFSNSVYVQMNFFCASIFEQIKN